MGENNVTQPEGTIAIIGAGVVGTSVAFACAAAGSRVVLIDREDKDWSPVRRSLTRHKRLARMTSPSKPSVDLDAIVLSHRLGDVVGSRLIVENVSEVWEVKQEVYRELAVLDVHDVPVAANTSAFPIGRLCELLPNPGRVIGVHFMNPTARIDTVEVVRGPKTSPATVDAIVCLLTEMSKTAIIVNDSAGFVINRILMVMVNQAAKIVAEGVAEPVEVDELFKGCLGHKMGPLRTADLIGIDTIVNTLHVLREARGDAMYEPAALLLGMIQEGHLGMKAGRGFYQY